ncbi:CARDB domain-containing protein [Hymenobacter pini]|uniref:CARDB domain-containing protein n=1 Tax=Hymenobacter pini TaxID=2880879 RepID=UPI001CF510E4|nr:CARDB domain-containing protein [Hymenobacter pini]MCA8831694.1 T9SS type A sorting domain-containing protein [Hymenobacter pini]
MNRPDLVIVPPFTIPATVTAGGTEWVSADIKNQGTNGAQFNCIGYYFSKDAVWDATDTYLNSTCQSLLFPGQSGTCSATVRIPQVPAGSYYLVLVADPLNAEQESDETNNVVSFPVTVRTGAVSLPDMGLWRPSLSFSTLPAGGSTGVFSFLQNYGPAGTGPFEIGYYLSTDTVFSASTDVLLGTSLHAGISGTGGTGGTASGTVFSMPVLTVPASTPPGAYYLVIMIDPRNLVVESSKANNSRALSLRVTSSITSMRAGLQEEPSVYPNPVEGHADVTVVLPGQLSQAPVTTQLLDVMGRTVAIQPLLWQQGRARFSTQHIPAGTYLLRLISPGWQYTRRILVQ